MDQNEFSETVIKQTINSALDQQIKIMKEKLEYVVYLLFYI